MVISQQKRQKKLARQKAKKRANRKGGVVAVVSQAKQIQQAIQAPVYECCYVKGMFEEGLGVVFLSRKLSNGYVALSGFLVDTWCLGVKDAFFGTNSLSDHEAFMVKSASVYTLEVFHPTCARKAVESAVVYARASGFSPHPDYKIAALLFGDIDASLCPRAFEFGREGRPFYVSGQHDTPAMSAKIVKQLERVHGKGGFHYAVALGGERGLLNDGNLK